MKENHIPEKNSLIKNIKINLHIFQKDDGTGNWQNIPNHLDALNLVFEKANLIFKSNCQPSDPLPGVNEIAHSYINFDLSNIFFYQNSTLHSSNNSTDCYNYIKQNYPERAKSLNYFLTEGTHVGAGYVNGLPCFDFNSERYVISFKTYSNHGPSTIWTLPKHISHELGHILGLVHTYAGGGAPAICNTSHIDYLADIHNYGSCPHDASWVCPIYNPINTCTNNLMGGSNSSCYYSPSQVGIMHRSLTLYNVSKYVDCSVFSSTPKEITTNETWDFSIRLYSDIVVKAGATLVVTCNLFMPPGSRIIIEPDGKLEINGGRITSVCNEFWQGIEVWGNTSASQFTAGAQGRVELKNGAVMENAINGIRNWNPNNWNARGGIIVSNNAVFRNNCRAVEFVQYHNIHNGIHFNDLSSFTNTRFKVDEHTDKFLFGVGKNML